MNAYACISCQPNHNAAKLNDSQKPFGKFFVTCGDSTKHLVVSSGDGLRGNEIAIKTRKTSHLKSTTQTARFA